MAAVPRPTSGAAARSACINRRMRTLAGLPPIRRDLIKRRLYLVPNSIVVSRGLPARVRLLLQGGVLRGRTRPSTPRPSMRRSPRSNDCPAVICTSSTTTCSAIAASPRRSSTACAAWDASGRPRGRSTRCSRHGLLERAVEAGLRSLFVGFETLNPANLVEQRKYQNLRRDYAAAIRRLHDLGVMINGSFVFGMDGDDGVGVRADRRVGDRARHRDGDVPHPHAVPGHSALPTHRRTRAASRFMTGTSTTRATPCSARRACRPRDLECGYRRAYREFYRWRSIVRGASAHGDVISGPAPPGVRGGMEEVRAALGFDHSSQARRARCCPFSRRSSANSVDVPLSRRSATPSMGDSAR